MGRRLISDLGTLSANKNQVVGDGVLDVPMGLRTQPMFVT